MEEEAYQGHLGEGADLLLVGEVGLVCGLVEVEVGEYQACQVEEGFLLEVEEEGEFLLEEVGVEGFPLVVEEGEEFPQVEEGFPQEHRVVEGFLLEVAVHLQNN